MQSESVTFDLKGRWGEIAFLSFNQNNLFLPPRSVTINCRVQRRNMLTCALQKTSIWSCIVSRDEKEDSEHKIIAAYHIKICGSSPVAKHICVRQSCIASMSPILSDLSVPSVSVIHQRKCSHHLAQLTPQCWRSVKLTGTLHAVIEASCIPFDRRHLNMQRPETDARW